MYILKYLIFFNKNNTLVSTYNYILLNQQKSHSNSSNKKNKKEKEEQFIYTHL